MTAEYTYPYLDDPAGAGLEMRLGDDVKVDGTVWEGTVSAIDRYDGEMDFLVQWKDNGRIGDAPRRLGEHNIVHKIEGDNGDVIWFVRFD